MQPQSQGQTGPEQRRSRRADRRTSGREQRKLAEEQAAKRQRWMIVGGVIAAVLVVALIYVLASRPRDVGPPVVAAEAMPPSIPVQGMTMGAEDAPVTIVEWGDYT